MTSHLSYSSSPLPTAAATTTAEDDGLTKPCDQLEAASSESDSLATDYASIASTIPNYVYENGRRYHSYHSDQYVCPYSPL